MVGASYQGTVTYVLVIIRSQLLRVFSGKKRWRSPEESKGAGRFLNTMLDIAFFLYAMDMRVRPTYLIGQIVCICDNAGKQLGAELCDFVHKRIVDELLGATTRHRSSGSRSFVELENVLILIRCMEGESKLSEEHLAGCFGISLPGLKTAGSEGDGLSRLGYFEFVTLLYYMRDGQQFQNLRQVILGAINVKFEGVARPQRDAELTLMFLDLLACPYLDESYKEVLIQTVSLAVTGRRIDDSDARTAVVKFCADSLHFIDWGGELNLEHALQKKELRTPYE